MNKKVIITEEQLRYILNEERHVSQLVYDEAEKLMNVIVKCCQDKELRTEIKMNLPHDFIRCYSVSVPKQSIFNANISIGVKLYNFLDKSYYENCILTGARYCNGYSYLLRRDVGHIEVEVCSVCGCIKEQDVIDTIQHEVRHLYDTAQELDSIEQGRSIQKAKEYNNLKKSHREQHITSEVKLNQQIISDMGSDKKYIQDIGRLMYFCTNFEQGGYLQGLYAYCMAAIKYDAVSSSEGSPAVEGYNEALEIFNRLVDDEQMQNYLRTHYKSFSVNRVKGQLDKFRKGIGTVLKKVSEDKPKQGWRM